MAADSSDSDLITSSYMSFVLWSFTPTNVRVFYWRALKSVVLMGTRWSYKRACTKGCACRFFSWSGEKNQSWWWRAELKMKALRLWNLGGSPPNKYVGDTCWKCGWVKIKQRRSRIQCRDKGRKYRKEKVVHGHIHSLGITLLGIRDGMMQGHKMPVTINNKWQCTSTFM